MKQIYVCLVIALFFAAGLANAENCSKYNNITQQQKYKDCVGSNPSENKKKSLLSPLTNIKEGSKKVLKKLNTDSKLTDWIRGK
tara:strand:+ start:333 stop:584 length:252 start_codon:yes stop_codon:yes gene_type:complete